jgi:hypothetical protein
MGLGKVLVRSWSTNCAKKMNKRLATGSGTFLLLLRPPSFKETF